MLNSFLGRQRATVACYTPTPFVSWTVLAFVGPREVSELLVWTKATDPAETCEVLKEILREVEGEVKELRVESCWNFLGRCSLTCTLALFALFLLIITTYAAGWIGSASGLVFHRAVVETNKNCGQKRGVAPVARGGGISFRARLLGWPYTREDLDQICECCCALRGASRSKVGLVLTGGCGLPMETCGKT